MPPMTSSWRIPCIWTKTQNLTKRIVERQQASSAWTLLSIINLTLIPIQNLQRTSSVLQTFNALTFGNIFYRWLEIPIRFQGTLKRCQKRLFKKQWFCCLFTLLKIELKHMSFKFNCCFFSQCFCCWVFFFVLVFFFWTKERKFDLFFPPATMLPVMVFLSDQSQCLMQLLY